MPMVGAFGCCAPAGSGQVAAPPTSSVMKSRRLIASPEAQTEHRNCPNWRARRGRNAAMSALGQKRTSDHVQSMSMTLGTERSLHSVLCLYLHISKRKPESWPDGAQAQIDSISHHAGSCCRQRPPQMAVARVVEHL